MIKQLIAILFCLLVITFLPAQESSSLSTSSNYQDLPAGGASQVRTFPIGLLRKMTFEAAIHKNLLTKEERKSLRIRFVAKEYDPFLNDVTGTIMVVNLSEKEVKEMLAYIDILEKEVFPTGKVSKSENTFRTSFGQMMTASYDGVKWNIRLFLNSGLETKSVKLRKSDMPKLEDLLSKSLAYFFEAP